MVKVEVSELQMSVSEIPAIPLRVELQRMLTVPAA